MLLLIDALNVAYWCGSPPALRLPIALLAGARAAGHDAELIFDASAPYRMVADAELHARLLRDVPWIAAVPSGQSADRWLLRRARDSDGAVISNDRFRDHRRRFRRLIDDPARLLPGQVLDDRIEVSALGLAIPLPATAEQACASLIRLMADIRTAR